MCIYSFFKGEQGGTGTKKEELWLWNILKIKDQVKISYAMKFLCAKEWCNQSTDIVDVELLATSKKKLNMPPGFKFDLCWLNSINFSHPRVETKLANAQCKEGLIAIGEEAA